MYVNYGRKEDFKMLKDKFNVNCTGKIVIVRYGEIYRGAKVWIPLLLTDLFQIADVVSSLLDTFEENCEDVYIPFQFEI